MSALGISLTPCLVSSDLDLSTSNSKPPHPPSSRTHGIDYSAPMAASPPSRKRDVLRLLVLVAGLTAQADAFLLPLPPARLYSVSVYPTTAAPSPVARLRLPSTGQTGTNKRQYCQTHLYAATTTSPAAVDPETQRKLERDLIIIQERLNAEHTDLMSRWVKAFCPIGDEISKANFWRGDAMVIHSTECMRVGLDGLDLHVTVAEQGMFGKPKLRELDQTIKFSTNKVRTSPADLIRAMISMASAIGDEDSTASLYKIPVDDDKWVIPNSLYLNCVPWKPFARQFFYNRVVRAMDAAITDPKFSNRMQIRLLTPETSPAFDTYRIGTILELVREMAFHQVCCGKRVKLCVQQKMGEGFLKGLPISLNGCRFILENMDWQSKEGEEKEGVVGTKIFFGEVGEHEVEDEDDVFILIAPQNVVGSSITPLLEAMAKKAGDRPFILLNPSLKDRPSAGDVMQVRGREERMAFAKTFKIAFSFETLHEKGLFKINGAVGKHAHDQPWIRYVLVDNQAGLENINDRKEIYEPVQVTEREPVE